MTLPVGIDDDPYRALLRRRAAALLSAADYNLDEIYILLVERHSRNWPVCPRCNSQTVPAYAVASSSPSKARDAKAVSDFVRDVSEAPAQTSRKARRKVDPTLRARVQELYTQGMRRSDIARQLDITPQHVHYYLKDAQTVVTAASDNTDEKQQP